MMYEEEEYPSDSEQSDEDYRPDGENSDLPSEVDSDGDPEDKLVKEDDSEIAAKRKGRKRKSTTKQRVDSKRKTRQTDESDDETKTDVQEENEEENKARADALWADFLTSTSDETIPSKDTASSSQPPKNHTERKTSSEASVKSRSEEGQGKSTKTAAPLEKKTITEIFEFAGEKVEVQKVVESSTCEPEAAKSVGRSSGFRPRASVAGGLGSILGQIGKKNKIGVLEKSKLDWTSFKRKEGIDEELQTHNKGKDGYLERQDFLERTDHRQFELERGMRQTSKRSK